MKKTILYAIILGAVVPAMIVNLCKAGDMIVNFGKASVMNDHFYCVILAGGSGERLWPLSRQHKPKQLLAVGEEQTLLDQAISRVSSLVFKENIWVSTTQAHAANIQAAVGNRVGRVFAEPGSRNTGPAILLSCMEIAKRDPQAIIAFLPADPFIPSKDTAKFVAFLEHAIDFAMHNDTITLLGVKPTYPATGFGYIEFEKQKNSTQTPMHVKKFHEKPSLQSAEQYLKAGTMLWNVSIFCGKVSMFLDEFKLHAPEMFNDVQNFLAGQITYDAVKSDSIDYAVMEKSKRVSVLPVDFAWCDVGNIEIFLSIKDQYDGLKKDTVLTTESKNNLVDVPNKLVALIGVNDLCIVETDQVLLITKRDEAEKVRAIVKALKQGAFKEYL